MTVLCELKKFGSLAVFGCTQKRVEIENGTETGVLGTGLPCAQLLDLL